ncbi:SH3 domain-containing protein [Streptomyces sp. NBC_01408]|uniref:SH3 domain-containing protein n=1 Tax=Streptomyces sp. NBC_01408 TaxID=2903855 RepID=UPI002254E566|nr:SH3 domain-containing protein [Streptomyces sp. NBC_01408]MCX4693071.1 SH3 domain-containing protein [Streptomyces sp. NBC_01408]
MSVRVDADALEGTTLDGGEWATGTDAPALFAVSTPMSGPKGDKGDDGKPGRPGHHGKPGKPGTCGKCGDHHETPKAKIVVKGKGLGIRSGPGTHYAKTGKAESGSVVALQCKVNGQNVDGNSLWYKLADGSGWIAARYALNLNKVPFC